MRCITRPMSHNKALFHTHLHGLASPNPIRREAPDIGTVEPSVHWIPQSGDCVSTTESFLAPHYVSSFFSAFRTISSSRLSSASKVEVSIFISVRSLSSSSQCPPDVPSSCSAMLSVASRLLAYSLAPLRVAMPPLWVRLRSINPSCLSMVTR